MVAAVARQSDLSGGSDGRKSEKRAIGAKKCRLRRAVRPLHDTRWCLDTPVYMHNHAIQCNFIRDPAFNLIAWRSDDRSCAGHPDRPSSSNSNLTHADYLVRPWHLSHRSSRADSGRATHALSVSGVLHLLRPVRSRRLRCRNLVAYPVPAVGNCHDLPPGNAPRCSCRGRVAPCAPQQPARRSRRGGITRLGK